MVSVCMVVVAWWVGHEVVQDGARGMRAEGRAQAGEQGARAEAYSITHYALRITILHLVQGTGAITI